VAASNQFRTAGKNASRIGSTHPNARLNRQAQPAQRDGSGAEHRNLPPRNHPSGTIGATRREQDVPRIHFHQQLAELKDKLLAMAALAQQSVETAVDAYLQRDRGLCKFVK
jgi:hypothetical protein